MPGINPNPVTGRGYLGQKIGVSHPRSDQGYKVCADQPTGLTVSANATNNVVNVYYEIDENQKFGYTVNYYIKDTSTKVPGINPNPVTGRGYLGQKIGVSHPRSDQGYKVCADQPTGLTVSANATNNVVNVYYEIDENQKFGYTVNYYIKDTSMKVPGISPNPVTGSGYLGQKIDVSHPSSDQGYKVCADQPTGLTVSANAKDNVVNVYYEIDENQKFGYTINYYIKGTSMKVPGISPNPVTGSGYLGQKVEVLHPKSDQGYMVCAGQLTELTVSANTKDNVVNVYYEIDENQKFGYTVNYYIKGTSTKVPGISPNPATGSGYLGQKIDVSHPSSDQGYKVCADQPTGLTVSANATNNVVNVYYEIDENQKFGYTVNYYIKDTSMKVPGISPNPVTGSGYLGQKIDVSHPSSDQGYKVCADQPTGLTVSANATNNVVNVYYEIDENQKFGYTVNYYIKDTSMKVPGISPNPVTGSGYLGQKIDVSHPSSDQGYKVCADQPTGLTVSANATNNVVNVYYEIDENQKFGYTVNYYIKDTSTKVPGINPNPVTGRGYLGQKIGVSHPRSDQGYVVCTDQPTGLTVSANSADNVVNVYYEKGMFTYEVHYYYENGETVEEKFDEEVRETAILESEIPFDSTISKQYNGHTYAYDRFEAENYNGENGKPIVTPDATKNIVRVYYAIDELGNNPEDPTNPNKPDKIPDKYQLVFTYVAENHGKVTGTVKEVATRYDGGRFSTTAPAYPAANVTATPDAGYDFVKWTSGNPSVPSKNIIAVLSRAFGQGSATNAQFADVAAIRRAGFTQNTEFTAHFIASDATTYTVEVYYEHEGRYSNVPSKTEPKTGTTDTKATVDPAEYLTTGYVFDDNNVENKLEGTILGDNSLVLKVYYKQLFNVTYAPGNYGDFSAQTKTATYNEATPEFDGEKTGKSGYTFVGWTPEVAKTVTADVTYTAQWSGLTVDKTVVMDIPAGEAYVEGDTVNFEIKVKNVGDVDLADVVVRDTLANTTILPAKNATGNYTVDGDVARLGTVAAGAEVIVYASHVVTADDVANKNFKNVAVTSYKDPTDPDSPDRPEVPAETDVIPTKGVQVQKSVTSKAAAADGKYVAGEKVTFDITVTNTGNTVLGNFRVVDQLENTTILEGAGYDVTTDTATGLAAAVVNGLAENASITIKAEHIVTEADLRKEHFKNVAVAELTDPQNPDNPKKEEGETPDIPKVDADANWKVTKTVTNLPSRGYFRSGETAEFDIKVENTGNQTLNDIVVADLLSGAELKAGSGYTLNADGTATIATLKVGETVVLKAAYTVTSADVTNKKFVNAATASIGTETETGTTGDIPTRTTGGGNSGGGGGGGSSSGPRDNGGSSSGGPGTTTVTIDPDAVPLANLPNEDGADNLLMIDDEDVPLAALPKTGQSGTNGLVFFLSSMMLAAFVAVTKKREDDK